MKGEEEREAERGKITTDKRRGGELGEKRKWVTRKLTRSLRVANHYH